MKTVWTDRSRIETYQRCARLRFLEYHEAGRGLAPANKSLPLAVGGSVHQGLEVLLRDGQDAYSKGRFVRDDVAEDHAVAAALADFATHKSAIALDSTEDAALAATIDPKDAGFNSQLVATAEQLGMAPDDPALGELLGRQRSSATEFQSWLWDEQAALVEGLVRAYARRRLRPLLEEFEVLEVEREGEWELASWKPGWPMAPDNEHDVTVRFMSRPDALLRSRADNSLYLLSFKTAASWDIRKQRDAEHDMQGLSEGVEIEKRLGEWWTRIMDTTGGLKNMVRWETLKAEGCGRTTFEYLCDLPAPPRILGIRYEYMLKGARYADRDLSARFGLNVWAQRSHLVRAYSNESAGQWCWSYDFLKDDGGTSKLYYKSWRPRAVWESMSIKSWIDLLDSSTEAMSAYDSTVGQEPRLLGYRSDAQAQGYTATHPLDEVFPPPMTVYRSDDQLRDWIEQVEAQERRVAEAVAQVEGAEDEGEKRHLLNVLMPMSRRACSYPTECTFTKVCYGGDDIRHSPLESGLYKVRVPNHPQESQQEATHASKT